MDNFFAHFDSQESMAILFFLILAFLFGLLTGYFLRSRRIAQMRKALEDSEKAHAEAQQQITALKAQLDLQNADLKKAMFEAEEQIARASRLEEDSTRQYNEMLSLNAEIERLQGLQLSAGNSMEGLRVQIAGLQSQVGALDAEKTALMAALAQAEQTAALMAVAPVAELEPTLVFQKEKTVLNEKIDALSTAPAERDDLTRIEGVGPFLAQKLNEAGIFTFSQIAAWDAADIGNITQLIGYFPGRIERDDWVGQAVKLMQNEPVATAEEPLDDKMYDLKVIEGIGPKIEELLKSAGILHLPQLADTPVEVIEEILDQAGGYFRMHTPDTWPAQARLAANGNWELLKEYQEQLRGGRETEE